jgi:hypothetical protein
MLIFVIVVSFEKSACPVPTPCRTEYNTLSRLFIAVGARLEWVRDAVIADVQWSVSAKAATVRLIRLPVAITKS